MDEPRRVDVVYTGGHWFADVRQIMKPIDRSNLAELIKAVQRSQPGDALLFVVDQSTVEGDEEAEWQLLHAAEKSGALVISSVQEF
ncbi:MAG: hypothetical protein WDN29_08685 [Methylovirgula sp.]